MTDRPGTAPIVDRPSQALQGAANMRSCEGCGRSFTPTRTTQTHCRPGCRVTSWRKRRTSAPDRPFPPAGTRSDSIGQTVASTKGEERFNAREVRNGKEEHPSCERTSRVRG